MNFKMKKIATAVAASLGASIVGMSVAHSQDEILFPYVVRSDTVTTILSVVNLELGLTTSGTSATDLHYTYYAKAGLATAGNAAASCSELNVFRSTSPNDIQTFDVGDRFATDNFGVMFNDPSINNNYVARQQSYSTLRNFASPARAFVIVDNKGGATGTTTGTGSLYGEAVILDFNTGAAWGYRAYNALAEEALQADGQATSVLKDTFSNQFETEGEVLKGLTPVTLLPEDEVQTLFFVTPIARSIDSNNNGRLETAELGDQSAPNISATVGFDITTGDNTVVFDRDENPISGPSSVSVTCVAGINLTDLLSGFVLEELKTTGSNGGGWSYFRTFSTDEAVAFKLEFNNFSTLDGTAVAGTFNTAVWLRNGTDRNPAYEQQVPIYTYDTPNSQTNAPAWPAPGIPSPYHIGD